jgi:hypothetical protein
MARRGDARKSGRIEGVDIFLEYTCLSRDRKCLAVLMSPAEQSRGRKSPNICG